MTTAADVPHLDPKAYGLPDEGELRRLLAAWVPECAAAGAGPGPAPTGEGGSPSAFPSSPVVPEVAPQVPAHGDVPGIPDGSRPGHVLDPAEIEGLLSFMHDPSAPAVSGREIWRSGERTSREAPRYGPVVTMQGAPPAAIPSPASPRPGGATGSVGGRSLAAIREDFPILSETVNGRPLVWMDNAATTQRPRQVIRRLAHYYAHENSNVHRGAHHLAAVSTEAYEAARATVAAFLGVPSPEDIVWVRGTTEALNLVAYACVRPLLRPGDEIILTQLEHHANIVPWQLVAQETGAVLRVAPVDDTGQILLADYARLFNRRTRFVSATHVSNALGTVAPVEELISIAHSRGVPVCVDGAQSVSHMPVNVTAMDADFLVFSGHKIYGPTGIGALYGRKELLEAARPWQGGGNMIADVTFERTQYREAPTKFEAGTGNIADAVGLAAALDYVSEIGMHNIAAYEHELLVHALEELRTVPGLHLVGNPAQRASVISLVMDGVGIEATAKHLDRHGIAVRAGHHCAQPILRRFGLEGTVRPSLAFYNTHEEVELLARALRELS